MGEAVSEDLRKIMSFTVGGQDFGADISYIREIKGGANLSKVPGAPSVISGVMNLRGTIIPIVNIYELLGASVDRKVEGRVVIIVSCRGHDFGMLVDQVLEIISLPSERFVELGPNNSLPEVSYISDLIKMDDGDVLSFLDVKKISSHIQERKDAL